MTYLECEQVACKIVKENLLVLASETPALVTAIAKAVQQAYFEGQEFAWKKENQ